MYKIFKLFLVGNFVAYFLVLLCSCVRHAENENVLRAEHYLWQNRDSALLLLTKTESERLCAADEHVATMLRAFFNYCGDRPIDLESLSQTITFFMENEAWNRAGLGYYIRGSEYIRLLQNDSAIMDLKCAEKVLQMADTVPDMQWGQLYYAEGTIFEQEGMGEVAFACYDKALLYFKRCNALYVINTLCALGRVATDNPVDYFRQALAVADSVGSQVDVLPLVAGYIAGDACQLPCSDMTLDFYRALAPKYPYYTALLAEAFLCRGELDSCKYYTDVFAEVVDHYAWQSSKLDFLRASYLARCTRTEEAFELLRNAYIRLERQQFDNNRLETYKILRRFDVREEKEKNHLLSVEMQHQRAVFLAALFAVLFCLSVTMGVCVVFYQRNKLQRQTIASEREKAVNLLRFKIECTIKMNVDTNLGKYTLEQLPQNVRDIVCQTTYCGDRWKVLRNELSAVYGRFFETLHNIYPNLTDKDVLIACLLGLEFKNREIILLLWMNESTFYRRRDLLKERMNLPPMQKLDAVCRNVMNLTIDIR